MTAPLHNASKCKTQTTQTGKPEQWPQRRRCFTQRCRESNEEADARRAKVISQVALGRHTEKHSPLHAFLPVPHSELRQHIFEIMFLLWKGWQDWTGHSCTVRKWRLTGQRARGRANTEGQQMKCLEMFVRVSSLPHFIRCAVLSPKTKAKDNIHHC